MFVAPTGELIGDVLQNEEGILYAKIDVSQCVELEQFASLTLISYYELARAVNHMDP
jgi:nitrilase